jgi:calcium channel MID1
MPFPKLSPLQSRLAASVIASVTLLMLYFTFSSPHFAYAADVDSIRPEDHNHERLQDVHLLDVEVENLETREEGYEADFLGYDRGIIGRTPPSSNSPIQLANNIVVNTTITQGQTSQYVFLSSNQARIRASTSYQEDENEWSEEAGWRSQISPTIDVN